MGGHGEMQRETGSMARRPDVSLLLEVNVTFGHEFPESVSQMRSPLVHACF